MKGDWTDALSPILLKELTQGVRTKSFGTVFLLTQLVMLLVTLSLVGAESGGNQQQQALMFWGAISVSFVLLLPCLALGSIHSEVKIKTMEMLYLSRLSAARIVIGKYYSQIVQTFLLAVTILPYIVMRYFAGGINLSREGLVLTFILLISSIVTALSVAVSSFSTVSPKSHLLRVILALVAYVIILQSSMAGVAFYLFEGFGFLGAGATSLIDFVALLLMTPFVVYQILALGISQVAPEAENSLPRKRLNCFFILFLYLTLRYFSESFVMALPVVFCFLLSAAQDFFNKEMTHKSSYRPVFKRPSLALLFAPNFFGSMIWVNFSLLMVLLTICLEVFASQTGSYHLLLWAAPLVLCLFYYLVINLAKSANLQRMISFIAAFFLPLALFCTSLWSMTELDDIHDMFQFSLVLYLNFFIPYGVALFIARVRQKPLQFKYFIVSLAIVTLLGSLSIIIKNAVFINTYNLVRLFPLELFSMFDNNPLDKSFIVYLQALIAGIAVFVTAKDSAVVFRTKYREYKPAQDITESQQAPE